MTVHRGRLLAVFATLLVWGLPALAGEFVVVEAPGGAFPAGQVIAGAERISVPAQVTLTVIRDDGEVLRVAGPFTGKLDAAAGGRAKAAAGETSVVQTISRLLQTADPPQSKALLTVRGGVGSGGSAAAEPVTVDILRSGTYCLPAGTRPVLGRARDGGFRTAVLTETASGASAAVPFAAFVTAQPWPDALPLADGLAYRIAPAGDSPGETFVLRWMPGGLSNDGRRIAWLAEHECVDQAMLLLNALTANAAGER